MCIDTNKESTHPLEFPRAFESRLLVPKNEAPVFIISFNGPFFLRYEQFHRKYPLFRQKIMSLLLTVTLQIFKIRKRATKIIKVDSKSSNFQQNCKSRLAAELRQTCGSYSAVIGPTNCTCECSRITADLRHPKCTSFIW